MKRKRMSRDITKNPESLPADWLVSPEMELWAKEKTPDVILRIATAKFLNYYDGRRQKDWDKTWRNWMLGDQERHEQRNKTNQGAGRNNYQGRRGGSQHTPYRDPEDISRYKTSKI